MSNFREKSEAIVPLSNVYFKDSDEWPRVRELLLSQIEKALTEAHDLGVERSAKEMDEVLDLRMDELVASKRQIRELKLGKGE